VVTGNAAPDTLVTQELVSLQVEADAMSIPEEIEVSVEGAEIGTQILASDVPLPPGVGLRTDPEYLVVNIVAAPTTADLESETTGEEPASTGTGATDDQA
ncbi:MAG: ribosomal protein, partial [Pseudonocardiales bacterium]|nr:ribosomal protein [Pseudonocardiales bacterium]